MNYRFLLDTKGVSYCKSIFDNILKKEFTNKDVLKKIIEEENNNILYENDYRVYVRDLPRLTILNKLYVTPDNNIYKYDFLNREWVEVYGG